MRTSQILTALGLMAFSIAVMAQAYQVGAKWTEGQAGPGFFPFWLAVLLCLCGVIILGRTIFTVEGAPFFHDRTGLLSVVTVTLTGAGMLVLTYLVGFRAASIVYLFVYTRFIGKHRWPAVIVMSLLIPIGGYILFERILLIGLPRGIFSIPFLD